MGFFKRFSQVFLVFSVFAAYFIRQRALEHKAYALSREGCAAADLVLEGVSRFHELKHAFADWLNDDEFTGYKGMSKELSIFQDCVNMFWSVGSEHLLNWLPERVFTAFYRLVFNWMGCLLPPTEHCRLTEDSIAGVPVLWIRDAKKATAGTRVNDDRLLVYFHGGSFLFGGDSHAGLGCRLTAASGGITTLLVKYSLAPKASIPLQTKQLLDIYKVLLEYMQISSDKIVFAGDSAGGSLALLAVQRIAELNTLEKNNVIPQPNGVLAFSPWLDLSMTSSQKASSDWIVRYESSQRMAVIATAEVDANKRKDPRFSAMYGTIKGLPQRIYISVSKSERLSDETEDFCIKLTNDGTEWKTGKYLTAPPNELYCEKFERMPHALIAFVGVFPEADEHLLENAKRIKRWLS